MRTRAAPCAERCGAAAMRSSFRLLRRKLCYDPRSCPLPGVALFASLAKKSVPASRRATAARRATICEEKCYDGTARTRCIGCYDGTARAVPISFFQNNTGTCSECSGATPIQIVSCHTRTRLPRVSANALARLSQRPRRGGASGGTCRGHPHPRERCGSLPMPLTPTTP